MTPIEVVIAAVIIIGCVWMFRWVFTSRMRVKNLRKLGYEFIWQSPVKNNSLWLKNEIVFLICNNKEQGAQVADVLGLSEIRKGKKLTGLLLRYRVSGIVNEAQITGSNSHLLTLADKLGFGYGS